MLRQTIITCAIVASSCIATATPNENRTLEEIYQAAQEETGVLNVYFGGSSQAAANPLLTAFNKAFPKVKINITAELSKYADSRIDRSYIENEPSIDYAMLQTVQDFPRWKAEGKLLEYKPPNFEDVNHAIKDEDGAFVPVGFNQFGPFYFDSDKLSLEQVPKSYADVLHPFWKDKIALTYPNDDDGVLYQFVLIIQQHGFSWLDGLLRQNVMWVRGATAATGAIIKDHESTNGSRILSFSGLGGFTPSTTFLKVQQPTLPDRFMTWAQQGAIFKSTQMPESAKLLSAFLLSDAWQKPIAARGAPTVRASLSADNDVFASDNTEPLGYVRFMSNRTEVEWWRMQMETSIGLAVGPDPVLA